jgi:type II restriction enzyme
MPKLKDLIRRKWNTGDTFTLDEIYQFAEHFRVSRPSNDHIPDKLRQTMQHLRDAGMIEFIDNAGLYRLL